MNNLRDYKNNSIKLKELELLQESSFLEYDSHKTKSDELYFIYKANENKYIDERNRLLRYFNRLLRHLLKDNVILNSYQEIDNVFIFNFYEENTSNIFSLEFPSEFLDWNKDEILEYYEKYKNGNINKQIEDYKNKILELERELNKV